MNNRRIYRLIMALYFSIFCFLGNSQIVTTTKKDTLQTDSLSILKSGKRPKINFSEQLTSRFTSKTNSSPFSLKTNGLYKYDFNFNPEGKITLGQTLVAKPGLFQNYYYPETISLDQFSTIQNDLIFKQTLRDYAKIADGQSDVSGRGLRPKIADGKLTGEFLGEKIELQPNGFVTVDIGAFFQNSDNPMLPIRLRKINQFMFNQQASFNLTGGIGDKMKINTNFDTKASFNFQNQLKLNYRAQEEDIVQKVEAGNISFNLPTTLITGVNNLIGFKTQLRFGKLDVTLAASQQRSKVESIFLKGGSQAKGFEIRCDNYDENRHFFLAHFFRDNYEKWLKNMPVPISGINITRLEVYVTNRTGNTETLRNIAGFADLGELKPFNTTVRPLTGAIAADNKSNNLYKSIFDIVTAREVDQVNSRMQGTLGLKRGEDFELLRGAKKLTERDFRFNQELGYISLLTPLKNDEVLAVSYEYTYQGRQYKVGELTEDYQDRKDDQVLFMKMLKSSTIRNNLANPMWNLMMKNVYSLNINTVVKQGFQLRVIYKDDQTGIDNPNLQEGAKTKDVSLIRIMGLDRLNQQLDQQPDGNFDFVENTTVDTRFGKIIFPVLEPFGSHLRKQFSAAEADLVKKYVFDDLYTKTLADAQQVTGKNKFFLKGNMQGGGGGSSGSAGGGTAISLPFGVDANTVKVYSGGVALSQGSDYIVDPSSGQLRIVNQSLGSSGREIRIDYERPDLFANQIRTMVAGRFDYNLSNDIRLGATIMKYKETPAGFLRRVALGSEPVNNTIIGFDGAFRKESKFLTKLIDKLPLLQTKEISQIDFQGEYAQLFPGVAPRVNGNSFIDDFEGSRIVYDLARQANKWKLGAVPEPFKLTIGDEGNVNNAFKRAKISAYNADPSFFGIGGGSGFDAPSNFDEKDQQNVYERKITVNDIFKGKDVQTLQGFPTSIFDVSYFPSERGSYNFNTDLTPEGLLRNPEKNFGAITRAIPSDIDFDNANIEILEFWMMDPFHEGENGKVKDGIFNQNNTSGGILQIQMGDVSEDFIPDSRFNFENGYPQKDENVILPQTGYGYAPKQQFITNAFDNKDGSREAQDIGLDGLSSTNNGTSEKEFPPFKKYLEEIKNKVNAKAFAEFENDPAGDDYKYYFNPEFNKSTNPNEKLVFRYKNGMGMENNSPPTTNSGAIQLSESGTNLPDMEDLNNDNTINDIEAYYQYDIDLRKGGLAVGKGYVVDQLDNGDQGKWYLMRIPIRSGKPVGNINGFKSMRFIRMVLTDFRQPVVMRFGQLQLTSFQYRKYVKDLSESEKPGIDTPEPNAISTQFKVSTVSIEENQSGNGVSVPYRVPPGFERDRDITSFNNAQLNEQSLSLCVEKLKAGDSRAVFKNTGFDFLSYKNLNMFLHLENKDAGNSNLDGKISAFIRLGTDLNENYYEIEKLGLKESAKKNDPTSEEVWPEENFVDVPFENLRFLKLSRDKPGKNVNPLTVKYSEPFENSTGKYILSVVGRPDMSTVQTMMMGVRNPKQNNDDLSFCVWMDEMRVNGFDQTAGYAAIGKVNLKLADFATVTMNGSIKTFGFGAVQQRISERNRDIKTDFGIASNIALEKLFPMKWGLQIPLFISYDDALITPKFDPLDPDMFLDDVVKTKGDGYRLLTDDHTVRKGFNFANIHKSKTDPNAKNKFYSIENFSASYAFNEMKRKSVLITDYTMRSIKGGLTYTYATEPGIWEPFKNAKRMNRPSLAPIKDFNLSLLPNSITLRADMDRSFVKTELRNADYTSQQPFYEKYWLFNRLYDINWNLSKSLILNYNAVANAIIDEPIGAVDNQIALDSIRYNLRNFGRPKLFTQNISATWRVPLEKFPVLDWMTADYSWKVGNNYTAGTFGVRDDFGDLYGNIARNNRDQQLTGKIDFVALYNKVRYLKFANNPSEKKTIIVQNPGSMEDIPKVSSKVMKKFTRLVMAIRGINYTFSLQEATILPGFLPAPKYFGLGKSYLDSVTRKTFKNYGPGLPFVLGSQNINILEKAKDNNWLTRSTQQNLPFTQTRTKRVEFRTQIEPAKDLQIQLEARWTRTDNYQEFYRPDSVGRGFKSISPVRSGNFTMSYMSFLTAFKLTNKDGSSENFNTFLKYRKDILTRLNENDVEKTGKFNEKSQDVLIPAFFAAYSGKDVKKVSLSPFRGIPLPNWRLNYKGLANLAPFNKWFTTLEISHAYTSTYSVGNFVSSLEYFDPYLLRFNQNNARLHFLGFDSNYENFTDTKFRYPFAKQFNDGNQYVPVYVMSIISFTEKFGPFVGINFRTKSKWTGKVEYNQDRNISLNLSNSSVSELINKDWVASLGATKNNLKLPFKVNGKTVRLKNDLTFNMNFTLRDQRATLRKIEPGDIGKATAGQLMLQFRPQVQYAVDKKLSLSLYFDRMLNNPYVNTSFRRATTQGGVQIRYSLTP